MVVVVTFGPKEFLSVSVITLVVGTTTCCVVVVVCKLVGNSFETKKAKPDADRNSNLDSTHYGDGDIHRHYYI